MINRSPSLTPLVVMRLTVPKEVTIRDQTGGRKENSTQKHLVWLPIPVIVTMVTVVGAGEEDEVALMVVEVVVVCVGGVAIRAEAMAIVEASVIGTTKHGLITIMMSNLGTVITVQLQMEKRELPTVHS